METIKTPVELDNSTGDKLVKKNRITAIEYLKKGKEVEALRKTKGYKWISKGKTSRQVHPKKLKALLFDGWHL